MYRGKKVAVSVLFSLSAALHAQVTGRYARPQIQQNIDESQLTTLAGNRPPAAIAENDRGAVPANFIMDHMLLQLQRPAEQERALESQLSSLNAPMTKDTVLTAKRVFENQFDYLLERAGLRNSSGGRKHSVYSLRHTAICKRILHSKGKVNLLNLAKNARTSVAQI